MKGCLEGILVYAWKYFCYYRLAISAGLASELPELLEQPRKIILIEVPCKVTGTHE